MTEQDKWVRVMADYCSDGLWERDGCMMNRDDLPISAELRARHVTWCDRYETNDMHQGLEEPTFDIVGFSAEGLEIAKAIKRELPDWTVVYFDEAKMNLRFDQPRHEFEYEITSDAAAVTGAAS